MFHKHEFKKDGLNLWCNCGKIGYLKCSHKWKVHKEELVSNVYNNQQIVQTLICENCGKILNYNTTSGKRTNE